MIYGYTRTSTKEQHLDRGITEIEEFCRNNHMKLERVYTDQVTGKTFDRLRYQVLKEDICRSGDVLIISELDRFGRSKKEILRELQYFNDKDVRVMILEIPTTCIDLSRLDNTLSKLIMETINNLLVEIYATLAQAEMEKKEKRQKEGIAAKKERNEWDDYGRPKIAKSENWDSVIQQWKNGDITATQAMKLTGHKRTTFYKLLKGERENMVAKEPSIMN